MVEDITEKRATREELLESQANLEGLAGRLIQAHEEERSRIARELHDDVNQRLALRAVRLDRLKRTVSASTSELSHEIGEVRKELEDLARDTQALSHSLHSSKLEYVGLAGAASSFCREFSDRQNVEVEF